MSQQDSQSGNGSSPANQDVSSQRMRSVLLCTGCFPGLDACRVVELEPIYVNSSRPSVSDGQFLLNLVRCASCEQEDKESDSLRVENILSNQRERLSWRVGQQVSGQSIIHQCGSVFDELKRMLGELLVLRRRGTRWGVTTISGPWLGRSKVTIYSARNVLRTLVSDSSCSRVTTDGCLVDMSSSDLVSFFGWE
jgi:hypothetical protein